MFDAWSPICLQSWFVGKRIDRCASGTRARRESSSGPKVFWTLISIGVGLGPGTQGPQVEKGNCYIFMYIHIYIFIYLTRHVYICNSAICFKHVEGNGTGMFPGPGNK